MKKIKEFIKRWQNKGREKQDTQTFWIELLSNILNIEDATKRIEFEKAVIMKEEDEKIHKRYIDAYIPETKVLIEQKDSKTNLDHKFNFSGSNHKFTPYEQANYYAQNLNQKEVPRFIVISNFNEIRVYDNNQRGEEPQIIKLKDLETDYPRLKFLINKKSVHLEKEKKVSKEAGRLVGKIYEALLKTYKNPNENQTLESLNIIIVRLVFILYAEDAGILKKQQFLDYMDESRNNPKFFKYKLVELFKTLDTPEDQRNSDLDDSLLEFPYVNGGLFNKNLKLLFPQFDKKSIHLILDEAARGFNWQGISPTIFGAVFESTLNPKTRRKRGMYYTSLEKIHRVIDPLFLDDLKEELNKIAQYQYFKTKQEACFKFIDKLSKLTFLDPACGSGNFLTETYLELRKLENRALSLAYEGNSIIADFKNFDPIKVKLDQFYGIEINDFAVAVANTALFIAQYQMLQKTESIFHQKINYLPLHSFDGIHEGNALRIDWNSIIPADKCNYIMGNPPFAGRRSRTTTQKEEVSNYLHYKDIDYCACWFIKAANYMEKTNIKAAFIATSSITQGEQVGALWKEINKDIKIDFAWEAFKWKKNSPVYCVVIGFSSKIVKTKKAIYLKNNNIIYSHNINGYLRNAPNIHLFNRSKPISKAPEMLNGNVPLDGNALKIEEKDYNSFKNCHHLIKKLVGTEELLNNSKKYTLWLVGISPHEIAKFPNVLKRIKLCKKKREEMSSITEDLRNRPSEFRDIKNPDNYLAVPTMISTKKIYIPMSFLNNEYIPTNQIEIIPDANLYHFGILMSKIHYLWTNAFTGRYGDEIRYSKGIVYNNFPWPNPNNIQKKKIMKTAKNILEVRSKYPHSSLNELYDELTMPSDLRKAHRENDKAVMEAYGWDFKSMNNEDILIQLRNLYLHLLKNN